MSKLLVRRRRRRRSRRLKRRRLHLMRKRLRAVSKLNRRWLMTPNFKLSLLVLMLTVLLVLGTLCGCSSTPTLPTQGPLIPALPEQAKQTQSGCSPKCSEELTTLRADMQQRLTPTASPASPASVPTGH